MKKTTKALTGLVAIAMAASIVQAGDANKIVVDGSTTVGPIAKVAIAQFIPEQSDDAVLCDAFGLADGTHFNISQ